VAPKWRELADKLAEQIKRGEYAPGQQLPHIRDLVEAGEGSKFTVHAAYKALEAEGLVTSSRGHGPVVRQQAPLKRLGIARYDKAKWRDGDEVAFIADRVASGRAYKRGEQTQSVSRVPASALVAAAHGLPEGEEVYARTRLVKEGDHPTHTLTSIYRAEHVEGTRIVDPTPGPAGFKAPAAHSAARAVRPPDARLWLWVTEGKTRCGWGGRLHGFSHLPVHRPRGTVPTELPVTKRKGTEQSDSVLTRARLP
jgi:DNA-binding transcriptional regulator YhcF (GntR family)